MDRRDFLGALGAAGLASTAAGLASALPLHGREEAKGVQRLTLLHTNDLHDHVEPFPAGSGNIAGLGGAARRATLVKRLRKELGNVLLLDAGDAFQGTPYFNEYKGRLDYQLMSLVGYDAGTLGNHDFDNGVDALVSAMEMAKFPLVNCNFDLSGAPALAAKVKPWIIRDVGGIKVGITGVGVAFDGLVLPGNHQGVGWTSPYEALPPVVKQLQAQGCALIAVCSHLGLDNHGKAADDLTLAAKVPGIHAILSGHSHTFMDKPQLVKNAQGETVVFQVGFGGTYLGRLDFSFKDGRVAAWSGGNIQLA